MSFHLQVRYGAPYALRATAVVTDSYVATNTIDLKSYDSVSVTLETVTAQATTVLLKPQWSNDNADTPTNWFDETEEGSATYSGTESQRTLYSAAISYSLASGGPALALRFRRLGRHFRFVVKSGALTTGTLKITALPMNNEN